MRWDARPCGRQTRTHLDSWVTDRRGSPRAPHAGCRHVRDGSRAGSNRVAIAGKTGTAEVANGASPWFVGFAPSSDAGHRIAFAVLVENAGYGGRTAAPIAGEVVMAAQESGLIR